MWFSLIVVVLVIAIAIFQATQGFFSALIMVVLTICCDTTALGTFEWVASNLLAPYWKPDFAPAIALGALFGVPLILLRFGADKLIRRGPLLPGLVDRAGGGVCGVITALLTVGVMASAVQMVPFHNGSVLGYARVAFHPRQKKEDGPAPTPPPADAVERELWFQPDRFVIAVTALLSGGVFSGDRSFLRDHPDFAQETGWIAAAPSAASRYAPPKSIRIVNTQTVPLVYKAMPPPPRSEDPMRFDPIEPPSGHDFRMIRVQLTREARGEAKWHIFTLRQFRLLGQRPDEDGMSQYHPIAIQQNQDDTPNRHIRFEENGRWGVWPVTEEAYEPRSGNNAQVEVVFELPKGFEPSFIEYKRSARATVTFREGKPDRDKSPSASDKPPGTSRDTRASSRSSDSGQSAPDTSASRSSKRQSSNDRSSRRRRRGGNVRTATTRTDGSSHFGGNLPLTLRAYRQLKNAELRRGTLVGGHLVAFLDEQDGGDDRVVSRLEVPSGKRLLHLHTEKLHARSGIGKVLSHVVTAAQNFTVADDSGHVYKIVGKYAQATVNGRRVFEAQYFSEPAGTIGGLGKFDTIKDRDLKDDYQLVFLFLVDPGARIVSFSTGGSASRKDDLWGDNLVAPE